MSPTERLEQLHALHVSGVLTADEYESATARLFQEAGFVQFGQVDWDAVVEQPVPDTHPSRATEVSGKDALRAIETGLAGGAVLGLMLCFAMRTASWPTLFVSALFGALLWTPLSLSVKSIHPRSLRLGDALLKLLYGVVATVYSLVAIAIVSIVIAVKIYNAVIIQEPRPSQETYIPPAQVR